MRNGMRCFDARSEKGPVSARRGLWGGNRTRVSRVTLQVESGDEGVSDEPSVCHCALERIGGELVTPKHEG